MKQRCLGRTHVLFNDNQMSITVWGITSCLVNLSSYVRVSYYKADLHGRDKI